jgi:hypothetical protein
MFILIKFYGAEFKARELKTSKLMKDGNQSLLNDNVERRRETHLFRRVVSHSADNNLFLSRLDNKFLFATSFKRSFQRIMHLIKVP